MMNSRFISYQNIFSFFWPLAITNILMGVTNSIVNAGLTRHGDSVTAIATFSVSYVLAVFLNSPIYAAQQIAIVLVKGKTSFYKAHTYLVSQGLVFFLLQLVIILSPAGRWLFVEFVGVSQSTADLGLKSMLIWLPFSVLISWRGLFQAILIRNHNTFFISLATILRIIVMVLVLITGPFILDIHGALIGALAITISIVVEIVVVFFAALPYVKRLELLENDDIALKEFIRFSMPLNLNMLLSTAAGFLLSSIVAHSYDSEEALAVMAIAYNSIGWFVAAPAKVLLQCNLALVGHSLSEKKVKRFSIYLVGVLTAVLFLLLLPGPFDRIFSSVFIIGAEMHDYLRWSLLVVVFYPAAIGIRNYVQGTLIRHKYTLVVSYASIGRLIILVIITMITKFYPLPKGAVYGLIILVGSIYIENGFLMFYQRRKVRGE